MKLLLFVLHVSQIFVCFDSLPFTQKRLQLTSSKNLKVKREIADVDDHETYSSNNIYSDWLETLNTTKNLRSSAARNPKKDTEEINLNKTNNSTSSQVNHNKGKNSEKQENNKKESQKNSEDDDEEFDDSNENGNGNGNGGQSLLAMIISTFLGTLSDADGRIDPDAIISLLGTLSTMKDDGTYDFTGLQTTLMTFFGGGDSDVGAFVGGLLAAVIKGIAYPPGAKGAGKLTGTIVGQVLPALSAPAQNGTYKEIYKPQLDIFGFLKGFLVKFLSSSSSSSSGSNKW